MTLRHGTFTEDELRAIEEEPGWIHVGAVRPGEFVRLASGGPEMQVVGVGRDWAAGEPKAVITRVHCRLPGGGTAVFPPETLRRRAQ
jgi:uncharacterized protein YodC (DUF2158 family)